MLPSIFFDTNQTHMIFAKFFRFSSRNEVRCAVIVPSLAPTCLPMIIILFLLFLTPKTAISLCLQCETLDMVFHIIGNSDFSNPGYTLWTDTAIQNNVNQQNTLWNKTPFQFRLKEIKRYTNNDWAYGNGYDSAFVNDLVGQLRIGGRKTVNIFTNDGEDICSWIGNGIAAITDQFFPVNIFSRDDYIFLCGTQVDKYNLLAHHLGHWMSLSHPNEGETCDPNDPGDGVDDTPLQSLTYINTCDTSQDSCPNSPGRDAVQNFMDLSNCNSKSFTDGQIIKMYDFYQEYRNLTKPCLTNQIRLGFDIQFDSTPSKIQLSYISWGEPVDQYTYRSIEQDEPLDFTNKQVVGYRCINRHSMHEVRYSDNVAVVINSPGYFALSADGKDIVRGTRTAKSYLLSLDTVCQQGAGRFRLELGFDEKPYEQEWSILDNTKTKVADHTLTTIYGDKKYAMNFATSVLFFEKCLTKGVYTFQLSDSAGDGMAPPGYFKISLDGKLLLASNNLIPKLVTIPFAVGVRAPTKRPTSKKPLTKAPTKLIRTPIPTSKVSQAPTKSEPSTGTCNNDRVCQPGENCNNCKRDCRGIGEGFCCIGDSCSIVKCKENGWKCVK